MCLARQQHTNSASPETCSQTAAGGLACQASGANPQCDEGSEYDTIEKKARVSGVARRALTGRVQCVAVSCKANPCPPGQQCQDVFLACVRAPCQQFECGGGVACTEGAVAPTDVNGRDAALARFARRVG